MGRILILAGLVAVIGLAAPRKLVAADPLAESSECLAKLRATLQRVTELEQEAGTANQSARVECLRSQAIKIKGLVEVAENTYTNLKAALDDKQAAVTDSLIGQMRLACARGEKLLAEAEACGKSDPGNTNAPPAVKKSPVVREKIELRPRTILTPVRKVRRDETTCLRQGRLACLLAKAMELEPNCGDDAARCAEALGKLAIAPLAGWKTAECATVDDVYVVAARCMKLPVTDADDALSYAEALRVQALPVDSFLPERVPKAKPPLVLEAEVRAFLAAGLAAPLASQRPVMPY